MLSACTCDFYGGFPQSEEAGIWPVVDPRFPSPFPMSGMTTDEPAQDAPTSLDTQQLQQQLQQQQDIQLTQQPIQQPPQDPPRKRMYLLSCSLPALPVAPN
jgi:hypothetical protein